MSEGECAIDRIFPGACYVRALTPPCLPSFSQLKDTSWTYSLSNVNLTFLGTFDSYEVPAYALLRVLLTDEGFPLLIGYSKLSLSESFAWYALFAVVNLSYISVKFLESSSSVKSPVPSYLIIAQDLLSLRHDT